METERFEALIDAILAIIITIIVMEIPLPATTSIYSLLALYPDFITYTLSFVICFEVWSYHHNLFNVVNRLNSTITWSSGMMMMFVALLPHVTTMISTNFYSFTAQAMFGLLFFIININSFIVEELLIQTDKANIALRLTLQNRKKITFLAIVVFIVGYIMGYFVYAPSILVACVIVVLLNYLPNNIIKKIKLPF